MWLYIRHLTLTLRGDLILFCIVGPKQIRIPFLVDTRAQISAIQKKDAQQCGTKTSKMPLVVSDAFGNVKVQTLVQTSLRLPGDNNSIIVQMMMGEFPSNLLGIYILKGHKWTYNTGGTWTFGVAKLKSATPSPRSSSFFL